MDISSSPGTKFVFLILCWLVYVAMVLAAQQQLAMAAVTQQLSEEGAALIGLKGKLVDVDGYLDNWKEAATGSGAAVPAGILNPCSWTGIKCSRLNSSVISLDLSSMSLTGSLSGPDLGQLKNLVNISVDCNNLTGDLPAEIVTLPFLQYINVSNNNFSNYFPSNFSQLQYLQVWKKIIYKFTLSSASSYTLDHTHSQESVPLWIGIVTRKALEAYGSCPSSSCRREKS
jgi:hypothetical protein